jgi:RHS repeat-associated protein
MRIYRGKDGLLLAKEEIHSVTWTEEPVVADVDGDGDAEIIICGDLSGGSPQRPRTVQNNGTPGIHVFEDPAGGWAPTRKIWNQHGYHITNVNEDGTVPLVETTNWLAPGLNNFRLNTFGPNDVRGSDDSFTYFANDGLLDSAEATVRIQVQANRPPAFTSTPPTSAFARLRYTYAAQATDADTGDTLTFSLPLAPAGMTIDLASGLIGWTPTANQIGDQNVTVRVQDGAENVALQKYVITVSQGDPRDVDDDGDGLSENQGDCDDTNPNIRPGILDIPGDGIDQDCDGADAVDPRTTDDDGDGFTENQGDCNDANPAINPGATDTTGNGIDENCDGADGIAGNAVDDDGDGFSENAGDCNDADPSINPGAFDVPGDGIDQNCNGVDSVAGDNMPPTVSIDLPADLAEVTSPTDIVGTADDANFLRYTLELAPVDDTVFTTIGSGTTRVANAVLGRIDPTLLENGMYLVRLTAEDANGQQSTTEVAYQVSREMKVGNFRLSFIDLSIPVSGIPITIVRTYDSRVKTKEDFGIGWTLDIRRGFYRNNRSPGQGWDILSRSTPLGPLPCQRVNELQSHLTEIRLSDREFYTFALTLSNPARLGGGCEGTAGFRFIDGSTPGATLESLDGTQVIYQNGDDKVVDPGTFLVYDPVNVRLTTSDGRTIDLVRRAGITRIADLNGNELSITPNGIVHSSGKSIAFTRDTQGRVTRITDPNGNALNYGYDASGDLVEFTDQVANETTFRYDAQHNLLEIVDPLGNRAVRSEYDADGRLVATIDASGNRTTVTHDLTARQEIITDRLGNTSVFEYDERGNVLGKTDPLGNVTSFTYDSRDNTLSETDPLGNTHTYTYDASDNRLSDTDALGNTTRLTYNSRHQELSRTDPRGGVFSNAYDGRGNLATETDPLGNTTTHAYDLRGNELRIIDPLGGTRTFEYDSAGNPIRATDPLGNVTDRTFDANGNALTETTTRVVGGAPQTVTTRFEYDGRNRPIHVTDPEGGVNQTTYTPTGREESKIDPLGRVTRNAYDAQGRLSSTTHPDGTTETATYDAEGRRVDSTDRAGRKTIHAFDPAGRLVGTTNPDGTTLLNVYDKASRVVSAIDENGQTTNLAYDAVGQLTSASDPLGGTTATGYDATRKVASQTDPNGNTTSFNYDLAGRLTKRMFANGTSTSNAYDALGRLEAVTDQAGNRTRYEYDARGDLVAVIDALGNRTSYAYDALHNRISDVDPLGNTTGYGYDRARRQTSKTLPLAQTETRSYDLAGNLITVRDFNGQMTTLEYDSMNRLLRRTLPGEIQEYTYTAAGEMATISDAHGITSFAYDLRDRPVVVRQPDATELRYAYDDKGNRTAVTTPAGTVAYGYDGASRLMTVEDPSANRTSYEYDQSGNLTGVRLPNGITEARVYDRLNRLTDLVYSSSGGTLLSYTYTLGATGKRERVVESTGRQIDYAYDALLRIVEEQTTSADRIAYTYDAAGNRLAMTDQGGTTTYTYDANHRLTSAGATSFSYDSNGNLVSQTTGAGTTTYGTDALNRLTRATAPGGATTTYGYDALGNRVSRADNGGATNFLVDPFDPSGLPQVLRETDGSGAAVADYVYGGPTPLSQERGGATSFYLRDGYGSTRALASSNGAPTDGFDYDAFGNLVRRSGPTENAYLYNGQQFDPSLGFYYLRARYYDASTGRFTAVDPFPGVPLDPMTLHPYAYAHNDPVNFSDPTGQFSLLEFSVTYGIATALTGIAVTIAGETKAGLTLTAVGVAIAAPGVLYVAFSASPALVAAGGAAAPAIPKAVEITEKIVKSPKLPELVAEAQAILPEVAPRISDAVVRVQPGLQRGTDFILDRGPQAVRLLARLQEAYNRAPNLTSMQRLVDRIGNLPNGRVILCGLLGLNEAVGSVGGANVGGVDAYQGFTLVLDAAVANFLSASGGLNCMR